MSKKPKLTGVAGFELSINEDTYWQYYNMLKEYAINMFKWKNLPDTIDERYLELCLFNLGYICFFKDDVTGMKKTLIPMQGEYLALQCTLGGRFNVYNLPTEYHIYTPTGYNAVRDKSNSVIIYNNYLHQPTFKTVQMYAYRIYNIERTIDINLGQLKHPYIIIAPENQIFSFKQLWKQIDENKPMIIGDSKLDISQLQAIATGVQNNTIELNNLKHQYMNEALTFLGINNANTDKKERLITDEVKANDEQLYVARQVMLNARKQACEEINKMFGLDIDVEFRGEEERRQMMLEAMTQPQANNESNGDNNGKV